MLVIFLNEVKPVICQWAECSKYFAHKLKRPANPKVMRGKRKAKVQGHFIFIDGWMANYANNI